MIVGVGLVKIAFVSCRLRVSVGHFMLDSSVVGWLLYSGLILGFWVDSSRSCWRLEHSPLAQARPLSVVLQLLTRNAGRFAKRRASALPTEPIDEQLRGELEGDVDADSKRASSCASSSLSLDPYCRQSGWEREVEEVE